MTKKQLQNTIMRRIYYAYAIRTLTNPILLHGTAMFILLLVLTQFVSAADVVQNISSMPVAQLGTYFIAAVSNTEAWTLLVLGLFIFAMLSFRIQLRVGREEGMQAA